jgi:serine/threonine protein kinase
MSSLENALSIGTILKNGDRNYKIEKVLGAGGFGITYLASTVVKVGNVDMKCKLAIKEHFMSSDCERNESTSQVVYSNPAKDRVESSRKDFIAEAKRLQTMGASHPNIVKVNEIFEANNTAYYVMEYLEGDSLRTYVKKKGRLDESEMRKIMEPIINAVGCLHQQRMTHLDIKPDNIMLARDVYEELRPVLIDFGLSKHYDKNGHPTSTIHTLGCSDGYAPIEQYAGITTFSPTADIYALGATIYFCLTGKDPIKSTDLHEGQLVSLLPSNVSEETKAIILSATTLQRDTRTNSIQNIKWNDSASQIDIKPTPTIYGGPIPFSDDIKTTIIGNKPSKSKISSFLFFFNIFIGGTLILLTIYYDVCFHLIEENDWYTLNDYLFDIVGVIFCTYTIFYTYSQIQGKNSKFSDPLRVGLNSLSLFMIIELFYISAYPFAVILMLFVLLLNILIKYKPWRMPIMYFLSLFISILLILAVLYNIRFEFNKMD